MRPSYILGITVAISIALLLDYYIFLRGLQSLPRDSIVARAYPWFFWIIALSWFAGRLMGHFSVNPLSRALVWTGSFWFAFMLYLFLVVVFFDIVRAVNHFLPFYPPVVLKNYTMTKFLCAVGSFSAASLLIALGYANSLRPVKRVMEISLPRKGAALHSINIVLVSDLHMGVVVNRSRVRDLVDTINALDPDLVVMPGDILDEDVRAVEEDGFNDELKRIRSRYGVFAVSGNHEYLAGRDRAVAFIRSCGITVLDDRCVTIADSFCLAGREDAVRPLFSSGGRKPLGEVLAERNRSLPLILLDHQPLDLVEPGDHGVDLQLSGHTHGGQLWPLTAILNRVLHLNYGHAIFNNTRFYVSTGYGTWGPPVRLGSTPEIVHLKLHMEQRRE